MINSMSYRAFSNKNNSRGFTLAELMVAALILAFTISAVLFTLVSCLLLNESNNNLVIAVNDAQYAMEHIRGLSFTDIEDYDPNDLNLVNLRNENITLDPPPSHPGGNDGIIEVILNVNWTERGRPRSYILSTRLSR